MEGRGICVSSEPIRDDGLIGGGGAIMSRA